MKTLITIILLSLALSSCYNDDYWNGDYNPEYVCCREVYVDTLDPETFQIDFDYILLDDRFCKSETLIYRQIVDNSYCN